MDVIIELIAGSLKEVSEMTHKREKLKMRLEAERGRLLTELSQTNVVERDNLGYGNHMADDATEAFEQAKDLALRQNLERLLKQVEDALKRFETGTYGLCEQCGKEIDPARLKALPYATLCLSCQQHRESR
ncbi:MAG: conjugal transfer protein TraR [Anaerolineales bacterium]|nr:MAG: conjugal transfer protein TraR [Anaerolineales bacterium]